MNKKVLVTVASCTILSLFSCKSRLFNAAEVTHNEGVVVRSSEPYNWVKIPPSTKFDEQTLKNLGIRAKPVSSSAWLFRWPNSHVSPGDAQKIFEQLNDYYKNKDPYNIAKPNLVVLDIAEMNAMLLLGSYCFSRGVIPAFNTDDLNEIEQGILFNNIGIDRAIELRSDQKCEQIDDAVLTRLIGLYNTANPNGCQLKLTGGKIAYSNVCSSSKTGFTSDTFQFQAVMPIIILTKGFLENMSRDGVAFTLAHELAHYYHADGSSLLPELSFLYDEKKYNSGSQPIPIDNDDPLTKLSKEVDRSAGGPPVLNRYPGQVLNHKTIKAMFGFTSNNVCAMSNEDCKTALAEYDSFARQYREQIRYADYPLFEPDAGSARDSFRKTVLYFDKNGLTILSKVPINRIDLRHANTTTFAGVNFNDDWKNSKTVGEFFQKVAAAFDKRDDEVNQFWTKVTNEGLGWYSYEQRADDMALEATIRTGFKASCVIRSVLDLFPMSPASDGGFNEVECLEFLRNNSSNTARAPVGNWDNVHHSVCYRAWNLTQELKRHNINESCEF